MPGRLFILAALTVLAGCASTTVPYSNPDLPQEQWARDWRSCKRWAEKEVGFRDEESSSPFRDFDRSNAKKQIEGYAGLCMTDRGYYPVRPSK